jgi:hypothetical protein
MWKYAVLLATLYISTPAQDISRDLPYLSLDIRRAPVGAQTEGGYLLQYELYVTNWYDKRITIQAVDILAADDLVKTIEGETLKQRFAPNSDQTAVVGPLQTSTIFLSGIANDVPPTIDHRVHFRVAGEPHDTVVRYRGTPVKKNALRLSPPLRGDSWVAFEGPGGVNHHTAGVLQFEGRNIVPQRFAVDFAQVFNDGEMFHGSPEDVHSYRCYGAEALAASDARVVAIRDDVPDNPGQAKSNALPETLANLGGNRVVLDLGGGTYGTYFHLQPHSVKVRVGDRVRTGDVLALVGNSMSPSPHLHFQLSDGPVAMVSEGVPYVFDSFTRGGKVVNDQLPLDGWTMMFSTARH